MLMIFLGTLEGARIDLQHISIEPCKSATIQYVLINQNGEQRLTHKMEGEQYARWGNDDTIIYHLLCAKHGYHYKPFEEPEFFEEVMVWKDEATGEMKSDLVKYPNPKYTGEVPKIEQVPIPEGVATLYDDSRSVHNPQDIETITHLQSELDAQKAKIEQINKLLINRGII